MTPKQINKLWEKIILNSYYPLCSNDFFYLSESDIAEKITNNGKEILKEIENFFIFSEGEIKEKGIEPLNDK